jgi:hypothetical protein
MNAIEIPKRKRGRPPKSASQAALAPVDDGKTVSMTMRLPVRLHEFLRRISYETRVPQSRIIIDLIEECYAKSGKRPAPRKGGK